MTDNTYSLNDDLLLHRYFAQPGIMTTDGSGEYDVIEHGVGFLKRDGSGTLSYESTVLTDDKFITSGIMTTDGSGEYDVISNNNEGFLKRDGNGGFSYVDISIGDMDGSANNGDVLVWDASGGEWITSSKLEEVTAFALNLIGRLDQSDSGIMTTDGSGNYDVIQNNAEGFLKRDGSSGFRYENISIGDLSDVDGSANVVDGYVLIWSNDKWIPSSISLGETLAGTNVDKNSVENADNGAVLTWADNSGWKAVMRGIGDLSDVDKTSINDASIGDVLVWDASGIHTNSRLSQALLASADNGDILVWDSTTSKWDKSAKLNTVYNWGDHSLVGYITSSELGVKPSIIMNTVGGVWDAIATQSLYLAIILFHLGASDDDVAASRSLQTDGSGFTFSPKMITTDDYYYPPNLYPDAGLLISDNLRFENADLTIQSKNHFRLDLGKNDGSTTLPERNYFSYDVNVGGFDSSGIQQNGKMTYTVGTSINFKSPTINIGQTEYGLLGSSLYPNGTSDIKLRAGHAIQLLCDDVTCQQDLYVTRALSVNNDFGQPGQVLMSNGINNAMSWTTLNSGTSTDSPEFTGTPTAPTASAGDSSTQLATTAFVTTAVENLVGGAPGALDTLNELAAAINDDENYAASITTALATKQSSITESSRLSATYVGDGNVDNSEFGHLNGVTGKIQTQLDNKQANLTFGIADTNAVKIDDANVISAGNYAKFTANGIEGRSYDEVKSDLSLNNVENTALSTWPGSGNIVNVGSISLEKLDQVNYTVKTITKTSLHPYYGDASNSGYEINGHEAAILMFVPGKTYRFDMSDSSNQGHPLKFYLDVDKNTGYTNNVTESGTAGNSNAYVEIVITDSTPTKIFYQCGNHPKMGNYGLVKGYANLGNINVNENTITSTDSNGNINISPDGTGAVKITSNVEMNGTLSVDTISEKTSAHGIDIGVSGGINITGTNLTGANQISAQNFNIGSANVISASRQATLTDLELKDNSNNVTLLAFGATGNVEMNGTLSVDTISEKTSAHGIDIGVSGGINITGTNLTGANQISAQNFNIGSANVISASRQATLTDLELKDNSNNVTLLAFGGTGNVEMNGTLSVDTINEKTSGNGIDIGVSGGINVTGTNLTGANQISAQNFNIGSTNVISASRQATLTDLELKDNSNNVTLLAFGATGNVEMNGTLSVDTINEKTTNGNISITPVGTGNIILDSLTWPGADGTNGQVLQTDGSANLSWTTPSSGSYITTDGSTATVYYPIGNPGPSFNAPATSLKLVGNLRLEKIPAVPASGSLLVEDRLDILTSSAYTSPVGSFSQMFGFSGFNHPMASILPYNQTNIITGQSTIIGCDTYVGLESGEEINIKAGSNLTGGNPYSSINLKGNQSSPGEVEITGDTSMSFNLKDRQNPVVQKQTCQMTFNVGDYNGTTSLPVSGQFRYDVRVGGYDQTTGIQQAGEIWISSGSKISLYSPHIDIGSLNYGPFINGTSTNSTTDIFLRASTKIDLLCNQVDVQQDIDITRALSVNNNYGTAGQVLTSGGSGNAMSWTTPSSGSYITTDGSTATVYYPYSPGPSYSAPATSLKLVGNLRLEKILAVPASGSLLVEDSLHILSSTSNANNFNSMYNFSAFNHPMGAIAGWNTTNIFLADTNRIASNQNTEVESMGDITIDAGMPAPFSNGKSRIFLSNAGRIEIGVDERIDIRVGDTQGTTPVPSSGHFEKREHIGGYDQTTGIQQPGKWYLSAGTQAELLSPIIRIGSTYYSGVVGTVNNATTHMYLTASTKIDLLCNQVDVQQDIDITRALSVNNNYGTAGQVLTSGGSGNAMSWTTPSSGSYITTDTYTPGVYNPFPPGHPYASLVINAPPAGDKFTADHLRIVKDPNVAESGSLLVQGRLDIDGPSGAAGSKTALYKFSGYNHPAGALLGLGRLNVNVGNTVILAADELIRNESQARVEVSVGDYEGTTPVPSSGHFSYSQHIGGYDQTTGIQQPGTWFLAAGTQADLLSPLIRIGSKSYGGPWINGTTTNSTTDIFLTASAKIDLAADDLINIESDDGISQNAEKYISSRANEYISVNVGNHDGTTSLPASGKFRYDVSVGGYDQTTGIQQAGEIWNSSGTKIGLYSPQINIGSLNYGGVSGTSTNTTADIFLTASTKIDLLCNQVDVQQDIDITRALSVNNNYGTSGQVLTSGGSGNAMSWTTPSSGSSYITTDGSTATVYYPMGNPGPSYSAPATSLKLVGNLRLEKIPAVPASGSLLVEDSLHILSSTSNANNYNSIYNFSAFNHPIGAVGTGWNTTNIFLADTNRIASNQNTNVESMGEVTIDAGTPAPFSNGKSRIFLSNAGRIEFRVDDRIDIRVGDTQGTTPVPSSGSFEKREHIGGYDQTTGIQQSGFWQVSAGTWAELLSPIIKIGSTNYSGVVGTTNNATTDIFLTASTKIDLLCNQVDVQQDIDITRALSVNNNYGTAGQVLTSGGSGNAMSWTDSLAAWNQGDVGFRTDTHIDMMGEKMYLGVNGGGWTPQPSGGGTSWYWATGQGGFDQNGISFGANYTSLLQNSAQNVFITSAPIPWASGGGGSFLPNTRIHLAALSQGNPNDSPEIILESDNGQTNVNTSNGAIGPGQSPGQGVFPKIMLCGGKWPQLHTGSPNHQQQNAGYLHMSAGNSAALLSKRIYIGKQKANISGNSPLGLTHDGYGPEFNPQVWGQTYQDAFDPTHGQIGTEILSISATNIEIVSTNVVQFYGQVSAQGQILNSDDRLKHNEEDLTNSLDVIRKLKPQKYQKTNTLKDANFNGTLEEGSYVNESGFIAQDILKVPELAYCVSGGDFTKTLKDSEGVEKEVIVEKAYSLNYNDIFTVNVSATQELDAIVTNLLTKIDTLEARIIELENK